MLKVIVRVSCVSKRQPGFLHKLSNHHFGRISRMRMCVLGGGLKLCPVRKHELSNHQLDSMFKVTVRILGGGLKRCLAYMKNNKGFNMFSNRGVLMCTNFQNTILSVWISLVQIFYHQNHIGLCRPSPKHRLNNAAQKLVEPNEGNQAQGKINEQTFQKTTWMTHLPLQCTPVWWFVT